MRALASGMMMRFLIVGLLVLAPLVGLQAQTIRYIHTDALGSVAVVTDANRNVVERREYEPYGSVLTGVKDGPGYTGHVLDAVTGMSYMQQRYYDSTIGRFLSTDPVQANASNGASFNRYAYASSNPYRFKDPDGRQSCTTSGQAMTCDPEVKGMFPMIVPAQSGFPDKMDGSGWRGHQYDKVVSAGVGTEGSKNAIQQSIVRDPTPGMDKPATPTGTINNATPNDGACCKLFSVRSEVKSYSVVDSRGNAQVINVTLPGHPLHPGVVMRGVVVENGEAVVHNAGVGTGILQANKEFGDAMFSNEWYRQSQQNINQAVSP